MFKRPLKEAHRNERGITGLETAIILIAFVVVAAVFAYTVLSAGLFSSQKSTEAVYSGLRTARGAMEVKGGLIALANTTGVNGTVTQIVFSVANAVSGESIDFTPPTDADDDGTADSGSNNRVVISYMDANNRVNDLTWLLTKSGSSDADDLLEDSELFTITIGKSTTAGNLVDALPTDLSSQTTFTLEIKPPNGAVLVMQRRTPDIIDSVMNLN